MNRKILFVVLSFFLFLEIEEAITKAPVDVTVMSIEELTDAMDKGYLTSENLVSIYLERIDAYNEKFNAINQLNENALAEARELDNLRANGVIKGKLHGIPILVKNNIDVVGLATNAGTKALNDNYPLNDSFVVEKLKAEGAIILGSCNMSALAFSAQTSYSAFGYVNNVFDTTKTSYGSSGGSAVAVAAVFAAASLGTDTNSSVRAPASGAGLVGVRPTYGLVSHSGIIPYDFERDTVGIMSRNVADSALILGIIAGVDEKDVTTSSAIVKDYNNVSNSLKDVKIGVLTQYVKGKTSESGVTGATDLEIYELLNNSINKLQEAGAEIIYLDKFVTSKNLLIASTTQAGGTMCDYFNEYIKGTTGSIRSFKDLANSSGSVWDLSGYVKSCGEQVKTRDTRDSKKAEYKNYVDDYFDNYDLDMLLYPTVKNKASLVNGNGNLLPGNSIGSVIGYPSITIPMGKASDNISYGLEFLSQAYNEDILYNAGAVFEKINGNKMTAPLLAPALYEVPSSVSEVVLRYEECLNDEVKYKDYTEWISNVKEFIQLYNTIDNEDERALELLKEYESVMDSKSNLLELFLVAEKREIIYYILICLICICILIIVKDICLL